MAGLRPWSVWLMESGEIKLSPPAKPELLEAFNASAYVSRQTMASDTVM